MLGIPAKFLAPLLPPNVSALVFFAATHPIMAALHSAALQDGEVAGVPPQSAIVHVTWMTNSSLDRPASYCSSMPIHPDECWLHSCQEALLYLLFGSDAGCKGCRQVPSLQGINKGAAGIMTVVSFRAMSPPSDLQMLAAHHRLLH